MISLSYKSDAANFDITVFCEEPRIAYDRVHLSSYFSHHTAEELSLVREGFYEKHGIKVGRIRFIKKIFDKA
ncbi:hypothetical protein ACUOCP_55905, partial [Escherichia sp. R-CC3]